MPDVNDKARAPATRERASASAAEVDQCRGGAGYPHGVGQPQLAVHEPERRQIHNAQGIGQPDQKEERVDRKRPRPIQLNQDRPAEQQRADNDPDGYQRREPGAQLRRCQRLQLRPVRLVLQASRGSDPA